MQEQKEDEIALPENGTSLNLLQQVYRNPSLPLPTRIRAATAALPHEHPKLAVTAMVSNGGDFADQLEAAIERSRKVSPMIEAKPIIEANGSSESTTSSDLTMKPTTTDRRFRRW